MSYLEQSNTPKCTVNTIKKLKGVRPIVAITSYDALMTRLIDPYVDFILVGDSVGNTMLGYQDTVAVTLDAMIHHAAAVTRATPSSLVVADVPFAMAYESMDRLLGTCRRLMQEGGVQAIKIEVGHESLFPKIEMLVSAGIPVVGHIGLLPQNINALGNYRSYGNRETGKRRLIDWALELQDVGCFSILGEMINPESAAEITEALRVPFIGIGCGNRCDGQILVLPDMLGMNDTVPKFVEVFANVGKEIQKGMSDYAEAVKNRSFPESK